MARRLFFGVIVVLNVFPLTLQEGTENIIDINNVTDTIDNTITKSRTIYDYQTRVAAYKDLKNSRCLIEFLNQSDILMNNNISKSGKPNIAKNLFMSNKLSKLQIWRLAGQRITDFCRGFPTYLIKEITPDDQNADVDYMNDLPMDGGEDISMERVRIQKRSTRHYFVGRVRGQTQSQYLNYGQSNEPGTAEAESTYDGSKAVVSGSSGMGQAQSQSSPYGCEDCYGPGAAGGEGGYDQSQVLHFGRPGSAQGPGIPERTQGVGPYEGTGGQPSGGRQVPQRPGSSPDTFIEPGRQGRPVDQLGPTIPDRTRPLGPDTTGPGHIGPAGKFPGPGHVRPGPDHYKPTGPDYPERGTQERPGPGVVGPGLDHYKPSEPDYPQTTIPGKPGSGVIGPGVDHYKPSGPIYHGRPGLDGVGPGPDHYKPSGPEYPERGTQERPGLGSGVAVDHYKPSGPEYPEGRPGPGVVGPTGPEYPQEGIRRKPGGPTGPIYQPGQIDFSQPGHFPNGGMQEKPLIDHGRQPIDGRYPIPSGYRPGVSQPITQPEAPGPVQPGGPDGTYSIPPGYRPGDHRLRPGQPDANGKFQGQLSGGYDSNVGQRGRFSGVFSGQYESDHHAQGKDHIGSEYQPQGPSGQQIYYPGGAPDQQRPGGYRPIGRPGQYGTPGVYGPGTDGVRYPGTDQGPGAQRYPVDRPGQHGTGGPPDTGRYVDKIRPGQFAPDGQGQYRPGGGTTGQYAPGRGVQYGNGQYGGEYAPGSGQYETRVPSTGQYGPGPGAPDTGQYGPGDSSRGQYGPGEYVPSAPGTRQYGPGSGAPSTGQYGPGSGAPSTGQYGPGSGAPGTGDYSPGPGAAGRGPYGPSASGTGQYAPAPHGTNQYHRPSAPGNGEYGPGSTGQYPGGTGAGQYVPGRYGTSQYGTGQNGVGGTDEQQFGRGGTGTEQGGAGVGQYVEQQRPGQNGGSGPGQYGPGQGTGYGQIPGQYPDDSDSQVQTSVQQGTNGTEANAQAQGKFGGGTAQSQVMGTYTGSGSFSASAGSDDGKRGAQTQVAGGEHGAQSSAQGRGGIGQSQSQVVLSSETGDTLSSAQSGGYSHGTQSQVQASGKGGMADAQANGPGSTSSQAQIGFSPYDESEKDNQKIPFRGGGTASAQGGTYSGLTQSQIQGKFRKGIKYVGAAQAGSGAAALTLNKTRPAVFASFSPTHFERKPQAPATVDETSTETHVTDFADSEPNEDVEAPVTTIITPTDTADYNEGDYDEDEYGDTTDKPAARSVISQKSSNQNQRIFLDPLEDLDATIYQTYGEFPKDGQVLQPGQTIPGAPGFKIPTGLRGRVKSISSGPNTYAIGKNSHAQSVTLTPGTGKIFYRKPMYAVSSNTHLRNGNGYGSGYTYQPVQYQIKSGQSVPNFISVTKSETGSKNLFTGKKTPNVYYTQSSTCGMFTNTCVFNGSGKLCFPKPKTNPDGTLAQC